MIPKNSKANKKPIKKIKSSVFNRGFALAKMTVSTGVKLAGQTIVNQIKKSDLRAKGWQDFLTSQSEFISKELGELKGSLMKAGQMLSVYGEHFLPPETNDFLKTLQSDSPPLEWKAILTCLQKYYSAEQLSDLEIDPVPIGTASMGQVHRARVKSTDEILALKIQYPDVDKAIDSDLKALKKILSLLQLLPRGLKVDLLFEEVRQMLHQETDYELEASFTETYAKRLAGDARFVVPQVNRKFSNKKILATSYEEGLRIDDPQVLQLSQVRRNQIGENFLDLYFTEVYVWHTVQTDPHMGNYRLRLADKKTGYPDRLVLYDFGATRSYPISFISHYHGLIRGCYFEAKTDFFEAAYNLKLLEIQDSVALKDRLFEIFSLVTEPFREEVFDWKNTDLPKRVSQMGWSIVKDFQLRTPPQELVFLDRKTAGVFVMLSVLHAKMSSKDLFMKYYVTDWKNRSWGSIS